MWVSILAHKSGEASDINGLLASLLTRVSLHQGETIYTTPST